MHLLTTLALAAILATNPDIEYSGRIDFSNAEAPRFSYSGVSIRATVDAEQASVILNDEKGENYYAVIVDNVYTGKLKPKKGKGTYEIANFGAKGVHEIEIVKITEEGFGKTSFLGFELGSDGTIVPMRDKREYTIEFIGNSITCGYGNEGKLGQPFCAETENHYMSYAAITARSFNAKPLVVSKSGIGIYRNYAGPSKGNEDCMTNYYDRIFLYDAKPKCDFSQIPNLVCINLGTNDFSTPGVDTALFISNYLKLIGQIREHYPNPDILCLIGPMLNGKELDLERTCVQAVVKRASGGKGRISFFEMTPQNPEKGLGTDYHPTVKQNILNARELTAHISKLKEWDIVPQIVMAKAAGNQIILYANDTRCLFNDSLVLMKIIADGNEVKATDWQINEVEATMTITIDKDISQCKNIEIQGNSAAQKILRCVVGK